MPKEIVHWLIAEQTACLLRGTPLEKIVAANPECLRFGAIFPDVLFYLVGKRSSRRIGRLGDILHGTGGEDTYRLLRSLLEITETSEASGPLTAFWIGVASHLQADIVFHPLIYYLTGNYHDECPEKRTLAIQRHRRLEVMLDMYFTREKTPGQLRAYSLSRICGRLELPLSHLLKITSLSLAALSDIDFQKNNFAALSVGNGRKRPILSLLPCEMNFLKVYSRPEAITSDLRRALNHFIVMQNLCRRPFLGGMLFRMEKRLPQPLREITALFQAPQLAAHFSFLAKPVSYRNPVSGNPAESTVDMLFTQAVQNSADFCRNMQIAIQRRDLSAFPEWGPSLGFGISRVDAGAARYFAPLSF